MQRLLDITLSAIALVALSPLLVPVIVILRITGEGEVFFRQERVGRGGRMFGLIKFATMLKNSPEIGTGTITLQDDPRVLPFGRLLRATKINELPQLFNILLGDMSIIGPRPQTRRCFNAFPRRSQAVIVKVRPGLSGIGSVVFRDEAAMMATSVQPSRFYDRAIMPYKGVLEEWYVARHSVVTDLLLICVTAWVVVFPYSMIAWRVFPDLPAMPEALCRGVAVNGARRAT